MKGLIFTLLAALVVSQASVQVAEEPAFTDDFTEKEFTAAELNLVAHEAEELVGKDVFELMVQDQILTKNFLESFVINKLEGVRDVIINGNDNLPPLDPFEIDHIGPYVFRMTAVRATGDVYNFKTTGLQWYTVDNVSFNPIRMLFNLKMTIPHIELTGSYNVRARLALFITHNAGGNFRIFLNRIEVTTDARLGTNILGGGHLTLRSLDVNIVVTHMTVRIEGMVGSSIINAAINAFVQSMTRDVVKDTLETVSATISEEMFEVVNDILKNYKLSDLIS